MCIYRVEFTEKGGDECHSSFDIAARSCGLAIRRAWKLMKIHGYNLRKYDVFIVRQTAVLDS